MILAFGMCVWVCVHASVINLTQEPFPNFRGLKLSAKEDFFLIFNLVYEQAIETETNNNCANTHAHTKLSKKQERFCMLQNT